MTTKNIGANPKHGIAGNDDIDHQSIRNFYDWLGTITEQVNQLYPWHQCQLKWNGSGCDSCCHHAGFMISEIEWNEIWEGLQHFPKPELNLIIQRAKDLVADYIADRTKKGMKLEDIVLEIAQAPFPCPLLNLKTGRCTVYENRPILCRAFGYFVDQDSKTVYFSERVKAAIDKRRQEVQGEKIAFPDFRAVREQMAQIIKGRKAIIPIWIVLATS